MIELSSEYHWLEFEIVITSGMGPGIHCSTAEVNKVNKLLIANLNENTWKLAKPNVISLF